MDVARGGGRGVPALEIYRPMWVEGPRGVWASAGRRPEGSTFRTGTFNEQIADDEAFRKQITDDKAGYTAKIGPFRNYVIF